MPESREAIVEQIQALVDAQYPPAEKQTVLNTLADMGQSQLEQFRNLLLVLEATQSEEQASLARTATDLKHAGSQVKAVAEGCDQLDADIAMDQGLRDTVTP